MSIFYFLFFSVNVKHLIYVWLCIDKLKISSSAFGRGRSKRILEAKTEDHISLKSIMRNKEVMMTNAA